MFRDAAEAVRYLHDNQFNSVDLKIVGLKGRMFHVTLPAYTVEEKTLIEGVGFDGSSTGFALVEASDYIAVPDVQSAFVDHIWERKTLSFLTDVHTTHEGNPRSQADPRYIAEAARRYLLETGIADQDMWGPELEFNILDEVAYGLSSHGSYFKVYSEEMPPELAGESERPGNWIPQQQGYHASPPQDRHYDLRSEIVFELERLGIDVKYHHHEVGSMGQSEIELLFTNLTRSSDQVVLTKYMAKNVAKQRDKSVTFMPKLTGGQAGSAMHLHMFLKKNGKNVFYDPKGYAGLSKTGLYFLGGVLEHGPALMAFTNPSLNSYRRLVKGFEAPIARTYGRGNRSAAVRIPGYVRDPEKTRMEFRFPDCTANPYLAMAALLMAGIDGIKKKIDPQEAGFGPFDQNVYELDEKTKKGIRFLPTNLDGALAALDADHAFLTKGGVFPRAMISGWIRVKTEQELRYAAGQPHPIEYELYYDS